MAKDKLLIAVTGTPGAGKTMFAETLSKAITGSKLIELNDIVEEYKLFSRIDSMGSKVVKLKELEKRAKALIETEKSTVILVGHLAPEIDVGQEITIVVRISLKELIRRLEARKYQFEKVRENIVSETIDYCGVKSREKGFETYEVESDSDKEEITEYIKDRLSGKKHTPPDKREISRFEELLELVTNDNKYGL